MSAHFWWSFLMSGPDIRRAIAVYLGRDVASRPCAHDSPRWAPRVQTFLFRMSTRMRLCARPTCGGGMVNARALRHGGEVAGGIAVEGFLAAQAAKVDDAAGDLGAM